LNHSRQPNPNGERERETTLTRVSLSTDRQRVKTGQLVNFAQGLVNIDQIAYFTLYMAGGSSTGTLNGLEKERIV